MTRLHLNGTMFLSLMGICIVTNFASLIAAFTIDKAVVLQHDVVFHAKHQLIHVQQQHRQCPLWTCRSFHTSLCQNRYTNRHGKRSYRYCVRSSNDDESEEQERTSTGTVLPVSMPLQCNTQATSPVPVFVTEAAQEPTAPQRHTSLLLNELCNTNGISLSQFINEVNVLYPQSPLPELTALFRTLPIACKSILQELKQSALLQVPSPLLVAPAHSQRQSLHWKASQIMKRTIRQTNLRIGILAPDDADVDASIDDYEDEDNTIFEGNTSPTSTTDTTIDSEEDIDAAAIVTPQEIIIAEGTHYLTVIHPLVREDEGEDNDDNNDRNYGAFVTSGSIIGIYERDVETCFLDPTIVYDNNAETTDKDLLFAEQEAVCLANTLQPGTKFVAAAYCCYAPQATYFVMTILQSGVYVFVLNEAIGEFVLLQSNVQIPATSNRLYTTSTSGVLPSLHVDLPMIDAIPLQHVIRQWREGRGRTKTKFVHRSIGTSSCSHFNIIAIVHAILMNGGGVYVSTASSTTSNNEDTASNNEKTNRNRNHHRNGVQLLYVGAPLSYIIEQAGGLSYSMVTNIDANTFLSVASNNVSLSSSSQPLQVQLIPSTLKRVMEISPQVVHETIPTLVLGSKFHIQEILDATNKSR
jgi:fructose-1,6-bisphosphatase I